MAKFVRFRVMRGTTLRQVFSWEELGVDVNSIASVARQDITSNGTTTAARFKCNILYEGLEVYLPATESQRLRNTNKFDISVQLNNEYADVVAVLYGQIEVR
ncbi:hypothetical protein [Aeromonas salmonicida]|uniref:hypothetical protein n=1 Tax=Aeromonas salmonicida TaxID=645 RepID=UPI003D31A570